LKGLFGSNRGTAALLAPTHTSVFAPVCAASSSSRSIIFMRSAVAAADADAWVVVVAFDMFALDWLSVAWQRDFRDFGTTTRDRARAEDNSVKVATR